jgi:heterodisulfide reductase subunit C
MGLEIDGKKINEAVKTVVDYGGEGILNCVQCGACSAVCPGVRAGMPVLCRLLIRRILNGQLEETIEEMSTWACQSCNRCTEICPQGVRPQEVVFAFRRYQANDLAISTSAFGPLMSFYETGHAVTVNDAAEKREQVGLDGNPPTSLNDEEAQKELKALLDASPMADVGIF